jgi:hypothetical protein
VLVVLGNHEFYQTQKQSSTSAPIETFEEIRARVKKICDKIPNVRLADREVFFIGGVRVICGTFENQSFCDCITFAFGVRF